VAHFAEAASRRNGWKPRAFSPEALDLLRRQGWKGNVRELRNVVERALILCAGDPISGDEIRLALPAAQPPRTGTIPTEGALRDLVDTYEREVIRERLRTTGGHVTAAAKSLDLERSHLYKKCKQLGVDIREE
jgi:two-component system response regulator HydG